MDHTSRKSLRRRTATGRAWPTLQVEAGDEEHHPMQCVSLLLLSGGMPTCVQVDQQK